MALKKQKLISFSFEGDAAHFFHKNKTAPLYCAKGTTSINIFNMIEPASAIHIKIYRRLVLVSRHNLEKDVTTFFGKIARNSKKNSIVILVTNTTFRMPYLCSIK